MDLGAVKRKQGGADLVGFDFVQLVVGDLDGRDAKIVGGDAVEKHGREFV